MPMEKDIVFKGSLILNSFSGIPFILLHDHFNLIVAQKMVNKALQQLLNDLQHGKFNWKMQLACFLIVLINFMLLFPISFLDP